MSKDLREATKHAVGIEHANKRLQHTDIKTSEVSVLVRSLVKLVQGDKEEGLRKLGKPSTENAICHHFAVHDSDKDGVLTMEEFHAALEAPPFKLPFLQRQKLHQYMDVDGDGMIDVELDPAHYHVAIDNALNRYRQRAGSAEEERPCCCKSAKGSRCDSQRAACSSRGERTC